MHMIHFSNSHVCTSQEVKKKSRSGKRMYLEILPRGLVFRSLVLVTFIAAMLAAILDF